MTKLIPKIDFKSPSVILLIAVNITVAVLAIVFNWSLLEILFTFWVENIIIGIINLPKILMSKGQRPDLRRDTIWSKIMLVLFFGFTYSIFTALHGFLIFIAFSEMQDDGTAASVVLSDFAMESYFLFGIALLFMSHLLSFFFNYVKNKEYKQYDPFQQTIRPYVRVFAVHGFLIFGGYILISFDSALTILLIIFLCLKIVIDLFSHSKSHKD